MSVAQLGGLISTLKQVWKLINEIHAFRSPPFPGGSESLACFHSKMIKQQLGQ